MILNVFVLVLAAAVWIAGLWFVFPSAMPGRSNGALVAIHAVPPLCILLLWVFFQGRRQRKRMGEALAREEQAQAERSAARDAAVKAHEEEMRYRRFACDCRMVAFSRIALASPQPLPDPGLPNVDIYPVSLDPAPDTRPDSIVDHLAPAVADALFAVYSACRLSMAFPLYVLPPAGTSGEEMLACVRTARDAGANALAPEMQSPASRAPILFLPAADSLPTSVLSLFESVPDLPGAVILALDSPYSRRTGEAGSFDDEADAAEAARERFDGKPGEAVVAMLVTNTSLQSMLGAVSAARDAGPADSMTPYWRRTDWREGEIVVLSQATQELRDELADLPVLGRVHRAAVRIACTGKSGVLELTRDMRDVLEQAQINAGLIEPSFIRLDEAAVGQEKKEPEPQGKYGAIVHNAGSVEVAGKRLAALGRALYYFNIDLSPVDDEAAFNMVTRIGDAGQSSGIAQLALALVLAASKTSPILCARFMPDDSLAASFVMPAGPRL